MSQTERGKIKVPKIEKRTGRGMWSVECGVWSFFNFFHILRRKERETKIHIFLFASYHWLAVISISIKKIGTHGKRKKQRNKLTIILSHLL